MFPVEQFSFLQVQIELHRCDVVVVDGALLHDRHLIQAIGFVHAVAVLPDEVGAVAGEGVPR